MLKAGAIFLVWLGISIVVLIFASVISALIGFFILHRREGKKNVTRE